MQPAQVESSQPLSEILYANDLFRMALELAYKFTPDGNFSEEVRTALEAKARELKIDEAEAKALEQDFRSRLGLGNGGLETVVSASSGSVPATVADKGKGVLKITSEPELADVYVDGVERGKTPLTLSNIGVGKRTIRLKLDGYFPASRIERIAHEQEIEIHDILEPQTGRIKVTAETFSDAYPAHFYLDGRLMGREPLTIEDVNAGKHIYSLEADHHKAVSGEVMVHLDEYVLVDERLEPLNGKLNVLSVPDGAAIWMDGKSIVEKTDALLDVSPGKHRIVLKRDGYWEAQREIELHPDKFSEAEFRLENWESTGRSITSENGVVRDTETGLEWLAGPDEDTR